MIRNFVIRNFVLQEFSALGTLLLTNFVIRNLFQELCALQFCDQEFFDQELCTCTFKTPDSVFGTKPRFQHPSCSLIKSCGILLELPRFFLHLYQIALAARSQGQYNVHGCFINSCCILLELAAFLFHWNSQVTRLVRPGLFEKKIAAFCLNCRASFSTSTKLPWLPGPKVSMVHGCFIKNLSILLELAGFLFHLSHSGPKVCTQDKKLRHSAGTALPSRAARSQGQYNVHGCFITSCCILFEVAGF